MFVRRLDVIFIENLKFGILLSCEVFVPDDAQFGVDVETLGSWSVVGSDSVTHRQVVSL
jgi:hypothetical protein